MVSLCRVGASEIMVPDDHVEVWLTDAPGTDADLARTLDQAARLVLALREEGRRVTLHCAVGRSRTPAVVARYAVLAGKVDAAEALRATTTAVDGHSATRNRPPPYSRSVVKRQSHPRRRRTPAREPDRRAALTVERPGVAREVLQWVTSVCAAHETAVVGDVRPRLRPWSVTLRAPTTGGVVWFKAVPPGAVHEPALPAALEQWTPGSAPHPLGIEPARGWSLLPGYDRSLADVLGADPDPRHWEEPLRRYAALQRALEHRGADLLGLGLPDLSPTALPHRLDRLLDDPLTQSEMRWCPRPGRWPVSRRAAGARATTSRRRPVRAGRHRRRAVRWRRRGDRPGTRDRRRGRDHPGRGPGTAGWRRPGAPGCRRGTGRVVHRCDMVDLTAEEERSRRT
ncbi:hypothetical protein J2S66_002939 [Saccharothrix longispora]|uniref:Tyrosine specific protein phosphatases domain-containing protein n=1 Tax=Saccharothrix longispora TaxID=33920 RepID=A0ABU1PV96_9PSEU|nr:hypothetical protein [Saccharothrix longispora]